MNNVPPRLIPMEPYYAGDLEEVLKKIKLQLDAMEAFGVPVNREAAFRAAIKKHQKRYGTKPIPKRAADRPVQDPARDG